MAFPSLNAIRAFEASARLLSFKDAAEELKLSPSAVSRHIRSLERSLGVELFERGFRQVQLTKTAIPYARRLTEAFRIILDSTELASSHGPARRRKQRRVSLSVNSSFMNFWLADRLSRYRGLYPDYELDISIHDDFGKGGNPKADLRILFLRDDFDDPFITNLIPLFLFPVCAPSLVMGPNALRKPRDLVKHRLLHEINTPDWPEWIEGAGVKGVDASRGPIFHDPTLSIREALNGGGVALADSILGEDLLARGLLVSPFAIRLQIPYCYALSQRPSASATLGVKQFRLWLVSEIELHKRAMKLV